MALAEDRDQDFLDGPRLAGDDIAELAAGVGYELVGGSEAVRAINSSICCFRDGCWICFLAHEALSC
jgi:hypothetical protein